MERELTREEVEAQIEERQRRISERVEVIEHEARFLGQAAKEKVLRLKEKAEENIPIVGGAVIGTGLLLKLFSGGRKKSQPDYNRVPRREITDEFVASLARSVDRHIQEGKDMHVAIRQTLQARAPILLKPYKETGAGRSLFRWLFSLGILTAAGIGIDYAVHQVTGKHLADWIRDLVSGEEDQGYPARRQYPMVHGTAGARMPDTGEREPVTPSFGTEPTSPTSPSRPESAADISDDAILADARITPAPDIPPVDDQDLSSSEVVPPGSPSERQTESPVSRPRSEEPPGT